jgi:hypothetical protein
MVLGQPTAAETQMLGVAVLSAISIAGIHSAICPSYFTMKTFASQPEAKERSMEGLWISLGVSTLTSISLYFVFKNWMPVIFAEATALLLFGIGVAATNARTSEDDPADRAAERGHPSHRAALSLAYLLTGRRIRRIFRMRTVNF